MIQWKANLRDHGRAFLLVFICLSQGALAQSVNPATKDEVRVPVDATINGQPVHLAFDTGSSGLVLFRSTAERLKLKITEANSSYRTPSGGRVWFTEPCNFVFQSVTARVQFAVFNLPPQLHTDVEGMLPWYPFRTNVLILDGSHRRISFKHAVPQSVRDWAQFRLLTDSRLLGFRIPGLASKQNRVYVDTGDPDGLNLSDSLWKSWEAAHPNAPATLTAGYYPTNPSGLVIRKQFWARTFKLGSLTITQLPVQKEIPKRAISALMPQEAARLGMYALRRLQLIVDGIHGVVYVHPTGTKPPPYPHNRLGAVFVPRDVHRNGPLFAHVLPASPAYQAGIRNQDVLLKIGNLDVSKWFTDPHVAPLSRFWRRPAGTVLELTLKRSQRKYRTAVTLKNILGPVPGATQSAKTITPFEELESQASKGEAHAQFKLGCAYAAGVGVANNLPEALKWFRRAADQGYAKAEALLAAYYLGGKLEGKGVTPDPAKGIRLFRQAAAQGLANAQYGLGLCYLDGVGVIKDATQAAKWFRRAAAQGDPKAQTSLGICYAHGEGVSTNVVEADKWFLLAAAQGQATARQEERTLSQQMSPQQQLEAQRLVRQWKPHRQRPKAIETPLK